MPASSSIKSVLRQPLVGVFLAAAGAGLLTLLRIGLERVMGARFPFVFMFLWITLVAWWWGARVGFVTIAVGMLATAIFVVEPRNSVRVMDPHEIAALVIVALTLIVCALVGAKGRRNRLMEQEAKEFHLKLAAEEVRRNAIFDSSLDPIILMDARGTVIDWNPAAQTTFGYTRAEVLGVPLADLIIPPETRDARGLQGAIATPNAAGSMVGSRVEITAMRKSGERFPAELAVASSHPPGEEPFFTGHLRDISERVAHQARIFESETQLREMTDTAPALISYIDRTLTYRFVNQTYLEWFGRPREQIVGHTMRDLVGEEAVGLFQPYLARVLAGERVHFDMETPLSYRDADIKWIEAQYVPRFDEAGKVVGFYAMVMDITARKQTEEQLAEVKQRLEDAVSGAGIVAWEFDPVSRRVDWVGDPRVVVGPLSGEDLLEAESIFARMVPDDRRELEARIERSLKQGVGTTYTMEFRFRRDDDEAVHWIMAQGKIVAGEAPGSLRILGILADATARKRFEERLRESEANFRNLADNISQLAWMADETGRIFWYNRRWMEYTGCDAADMQGQGWKAIQHPDYQSRVEAGFSMAVQTGEPWEDTFPMRGADGTFRWFLTRAQPIRDGTGKVERWFGTNTDITAQRDAEEQIRRYADELSLHKERLEELVIDRTVALERSWDQLRRTERMASLGTFAAGLGHDLHNSLLPLRVHIEELSRTARDLPRISENVHAIEAIVGYLGSLSRGMRLFSRDVAQDTDRNETDPHEWKQDACRFLQSSVSRDIKVSCEIDRETPAIAVAPHRLSQAILNLVTNAGDSISARGPRDEPGSIIVGLAPAPADQVRITVSDNGTGMTEEVRRRCMEPYFTTNVRGQGGTGMGLSMVFGIVTNANGTMEIQSQLGVGTTVELLLPAAKPRAQLPPRSFAHVTLENRRIAAYVKVVLEAIGLRAVLGIPDASDASDLWVTDPADSTPAGVRSFLELHPHSKAVVIGGGTEYVDAGALVASSEAPLANLRSAIVTAAGV